MKIHVNLSVSSSVNSHVNSSGWIFQFSISRTFLPSALRTSKDTGEWMTPFHSARQIGLYTLLKEVLTVDEGVCGWRFQFSILRTFLPMTGERVKIWRNGWHHAIPRVR